MKISNVASIVNTKIDASILTTHTYISTECMLPNCGGIENCSSIPNGKVTSFDKNDILLSNIRPYFKKLWFSTRSGGCSNDVICLRVANRECLPKYLYYALCTDEFIDSFSASSKGTKMPRGDKNALLTYEIPDRNIEDQLHIVDILGSIDEKIENNKKNATTLESLMDALFRKMLNDASDNWKQISLTEMAEYTNGLAMQKYRPTGQDSLPVVKIRELSQGSIDTNSELADPTINNKFTIDDGDIVFAWSGTLLVKIWCGGKAALNQHLFKVTSDNFPSWFLYLCTKQHLQKFQNIAKGKAVTMGHIKREDLEKSLVIIPPERIFSEYNSNIQTLYDKFVCLQQENKKLQELKGLYLKKFFE